MSIKLMSQVWEMELPTFEKLVLLALSDCANDEGICWPSISTLERKTSAGRRTVQRSIRALEQKGILQRKEVIGKGCKYRIDPCHTDTGARQSPAPQSAQTGATVAPKPLRTVKRVKTTKTVSPIPEKPDGVQDQTWTDFLAHRKRKRSDITQTGLTGIMREAKAAGWTMENALAESVTRGWLAFKAEWVENKQKANNDVGSYADQLLAKQARVKQ